MQNKSIVASDVYARLRAFSDEYLVTEEKVFSERRVWHECCAVRDAMTHGRASGMFYPGCRYTDVAGGAVDAPERVQTGVTVNDELSGTYQIAGARDA